MGIDLAAGGRILNKSKKESRSVNVYLRLLIKVWPLFVALHFLNEKNWGQIQSGGAEKTETVENPEIPHVPFARGQERLKGGR